MTQQIPVGTWLDCGCCGLGFQTWEGYEDQDQDEGYGICCGCQVHIAAKNEEEWDKAIEAVRNGLAHLPDKLADFNARDRETQKVIVWNLMDKGALTFRFVSA